MTARDRLIPIGRIRLPLTSESLSSKTDFTLFDLLQTLPLSEEEGKETFALPSLGYSKPFKYIEGSAIQINIYLTNDLDHQIDFEAVYSGMSREIEGTLGNELKRLGQNRSIADAIARAVAPQLLGWAPDDFDLDTSENIKFVARIAFEAASAKMEEASPTHPTSNSKPPALWVNRKQGEHPTAESFLRRHYGPRLGMEGDLTLAEVGRYDTPLQTALNREFKGRRHELHALLPTVKERTDQRLLKKYGYVPQGGDRHSKLATMSRERKPAP